MHPQKYENLYKFSLQYAYRINELYKGSNPLTIGISFNYNYYKYNYDIDFNNLNIETEIHQPNFTLGLNYNYIDRFKVGIFYNSNFKLEKNIEIEGDNLLLLSSFPENICTGIKVKLNNKLSVSGDIKYHFWEKIKKDISDKKGQIEIFSSLSYTLNQKYKYSLGFMTTDRRYRDIKDDDFNKNEIFFVNYLTGGIIFNKDKYKIDLVVADSHLISGDRCKNTIIKIGLDYQIK